MCFNEVDNPHSNLAVVVHPTTKELICFIKNITTTMATKCGNFIDDESKPKCKAGHEFNHTNLYRLPLKGEDTFWIIPGEGCPFKGKCESDVIGGKLWTSE